MRLTTRLLGGEAPKMPYLLTVASSMYVGRVSPVILYFRGFMCGLTGERKGERLKTIKCRSTGSYEAQRLLNASTWFLNEILSNNVSNLL